MSVTLFILSIYNLHRIYLSIVVEKSSAGALSRYLLIGLSLNTSLYSA